MQKNILFFILVLALSFAGSSYFGVLYNHFSPQRGSSFWGLDTEGAISFIGFLVAYVFFTTFIFGLSGFRKNKNWIIVLLIPPALLWIGADPAHIYIPIILGLIGFGVSKIISLVVSKFKRPTI